MIWQGLCFTLILMSQMGTDQLDDDLVAQVVSAQAAEEIDEARRRFEMLYCRHAAAVLARLSISASRSQAEDLAQETWMRAWKKLDSYKTGSFRAWILAIATNCRVDWQRKRPLRLLSADADVSDASPGIEQERSDHDERARVLRNCLSKLDDRRRKVIVGLFYEKTDYDAVCRELGITSNAAYKLTHEAKRLLTDCCRRATK